jgi:hypothetical protein
VEETTKDLFLSTALYFYANKIWEIFEGQSSAKLWSSISLSCHIEGYCLHSLLEMDRYEYIMQNIIKSLKFYSFDLGVKFYTQISNIDA